MLLGFSVNAGFQTNHTNQPTTATTTNNQKTLGFKKKKNNNKKKLQGQRPRYFDPSGHRYSWRIGSSARIHRALQRIGSVRAARGGVWEGLPAAASRELGKGHQTVVLEEIHQPQHLETMLETIVCWYLQGRLILPGLLRWFMDFVHQ